MIQIISKITEVYEKIKGTKTMKRKKFINVNKKKNKNKKKNENSNNTNNNKEAKIKKLMKKATMQKK